MTITKFKPALFISIAALVILPGCTTSLASRTPVDIASNSVRHTDSLSGVSEVLGPRVKVFSSSNSTVNGSAQLRTAGSFTDEKGLVLNGGSYLDVLINYTTPTPRPEEARLFDSGNWAGGETALFAEFGAAVLDCRQNIRENYTPAYSSYGYGGYGYGYGRGHGHHPKGHDDGYGDHHDDHDGKKHKPKMPPKMKTPPISGPKHTPRKPTRPFPIERDLSQEPYMGDAGVRRPGITARPAPRPNLPTVEIKALPKPASKPVPMPKTSKPVSREKTIKRGIRKLEQKELNYYPGDPYYGGGYRDVQVSYRCVREENLRVFISRERLDSAEQRGLVLYLRPKQGREEAVYLPPNYITGFKLAAYSPQGVQFAIQGQPIDLSKDLSKRSGQPRYQAPPSADTPIIYGQP